MSLLDRYWPEWADRTPADERERTSKFDVGFNRTEGQLTKELNRLGAVEWHVHHQTGSGNDPGIVVEWIKDGQQYVVCCDFYKNKRSNLRSIYLWVKETRLSGDRPVRTAAEQFAAAALPAGDEDAEPAPQPPHKILQVAPNASEAIVRQAYRTLSKDGHADAGGSTERQKELNWAKEQMLS